MSLYGVENVCKHRKGSGGDPVSQTKAMRFRIAGVATTAETRRWREVGT